MCLIESVDKTIPTPSLEASNDAMLLLPVPLGPANITIILMSY